MIRKQPISEWQRELKREYTTPPSLETLRRRCKAGRVPAVQDGTGHWFRLIEVSDDKPQPEPRIYFVQQGSRGPVKIGFTLNLEKRLKTLQTGNPHPIRLLGWREGTREEERRMLDALAEFRIRGEWFRPVPEFFEQIEEFCA